MVRDTAGEPAGDAGDAGEPLAAGA